jgi:chorismate dehydratase
MQRGDERTLVFAASWYANTAPLAHFLAAVNPSVRVVSEPPSAVAEMLLDGRADAGLIPVVDLFGGGLVRVGGFGVCAHDEVRSVLIKCYRPLPEIRVVAEDPASHTSNALAAILLKDRFGLAVRFVPAAQGVEPDAKVAIGDRALCEPPAPFGDYDMAREWKALTGLPFVFAVWAHRPGHPRSAELAEIVRQAKEAGVAAIDELARLTSVRLGLSLASCQTYLRETIHYDVGPREEQAIERFRELVARERLMPPARMAGA